MNKHIDSEVIGVFRISDELHESGFNVIKNEHGDRYDYLELTIVSKNGQERSLRIDIYNGSILRVYSYDFKKHKTRRKSEVGLVLQGRNE